jgi:predicted nuclease of restriction endonuclease-like (RecB) superfamily
MSKIIIQDKNEQFAEIVSMIQHTRNEVVRLANAFLIDLYWKIGKYISNKIAASEWGDGVVKQLADYIERTSPEAKGFSDKNLWRMKQFYETYNGMDEKLSPLVREIAPQAEQIFRDQYVLEFIGGKEYKYENDLKSALVKQMKQFVIELGKDFLFIDEEYRLQVGNSDFRIDLLFYHRELQCLVAFELKMEKFKPEHLGQLNFYLEALDRDVRKPKENPSIGILLCKDKDDTVVEYALSRSLSPTMVAEYQLCLPDKALLQQKLHDIIEQDPESSEK